jgi:DNA-binding NarL/FixJ family response regulator
MSIRVVLADDHRLVREGLRALLSQRKDIAIVGEAEDGRQALELVQRHAPNIVILDVSMPNLNGIDTAQRILAACPAARIICLSMHAEQHFVARMVRAGVYGYLIKECAYDELLRAIDDVMQGRVYFSACVTTHALNALTQTGQKAAFVLSRREREILQLIAENHSTKEIACIVGVSPKTVDTYRARLLEKTGARGIADLVKIAIREGLTEL